MKKENTRAFVLLAGGGMGAWIWDRLTPLLELPAVAVDRRVGEVDGKVTIKNCVEHVARTIREAGVREAVLVAHSGAGILASAIGCCTDAVKHIVFISANIPVEGTNALHGLPFPVRVLNAVAIKMNTKPVPARSREKILRSHFFNAGNEDAIEYALRQEIRPEPPCLAFEKVRRNGMPRIPGTYIKLLRDRTISREGQDRMIANYGGMESIEIDGDHMVMLGKPRELAEVLNGIARRVWG
jgi:pimeloyl-ACP methyl ester carboxylesterase